MTEETATVEDAEEATGKAAIYAKINELVKTKTGKRIGKTGGREIFDLVVGEAFALVAKDGQLRFNGGFGSLHVRQYQAGTRRLPSGQETKFGERNKVRYEEGVVTKELIANGGDLDAALKARGTRAKDDVKPVNKAADGGAEAEGNVDLD